MKTLNNIEFLSVAEVMEMLEVSRETLYYWRKKDRFLNHTKLGGTILYYRTSVDAYLENLKGL